MQLAGFANASLNEVTGGQLAGFANYGKTGGKIQAAGYVNFALEEINGVQLAGFFNYAKKVNGVQIAIFNYADTIESGLPIGLFSFVRTGFHRFETSANDVFFVNAAYKLGMKKLYNSFRFAYDISENIAFGYGIGTQIKLSDKFNFNLDLSSDLIFNTNSLNLIGTLNKITTSFDYKLSKNFSIFAGPAFNVSVLSLDNTSNSFPDIAPYSFYTKTYTNSQVKIWIGGVFGLSFTL
jgi:hypothetical protein